MDEVTSGSSYYSQNDFRLHFGLGELTSRYRRARVAFGREGDARNVPANHLHVCHESKGIVSSRKLRHMSTPRGLRIVLRTRASRFFLGCVSSPPAPAVQFADGTQAAGIAFEHRNSATPSKYLLETMGGGVALLDYDNDGRLDVFFTNGAKLEESMAEGKPPDKSDPAFWNRLYRQTSTGTFEDVTREPGVSGAAQNQYGMGAAAGDYDNDGFETST